MSSGSATSIDAVLVRRVRKNSASMPVLKMYPRLARGRQLRFRIVRGQYGHGSPSTKTSHANRARLGCHGTGVKLAGSGIAAMSGSCGPCPARRWRTRRTRHPRRTRPRGASRAPASRSACRTSRRTARRGTRSPSRRRACGPPPRTWAVSHGSPFRHPASSERRRRRREVDGAQRGAAPPPEPYGRDVRPPGSAVNRGRGAAVAASNGPGANDPARPARSGARRERR